MLLIAIGVLAIIASTLLISPGSRDGLWAYRTRAISAAGPPTAAFEARLMTFAITVGLAGAALLVTGLIVTV